MKKIAALILAAVCILSLAACSAKPEKEICIWMHDLKAEDITSALAWSWDGENDVQNYLTQEETARLVSLLNKLTDDDFAENSEHAGITEAFGILIEIDGERYKLNQADAPLGSLEFGISGGTAWWIDNDELTSFVKSVCEVTD